MNYPIWDLPAPGLLIAVVAILHVFVSHFAVGGGLFLVLTEKKARRENDNELLDYLRRHSRFFILLTLVFGAVSGVGIWFTIGLVHPAATSSLINAFVFGWAIEWTFFVTEIAAAIVYFYGWDRLTPKQHVAVGWIYFVSAYASLVVINGILTFMLTPGRWLQDHAFWSGYFNPTFWPSVVIRTLAAIGLAGVYALFTASWLGSEELKRKLMRYAAMGWVLPMAIGLPFALIWYFNAAGNAGVPVAQILGIPSASVRDLFAALTTTPITGHPIAHQAYRAAFTAISLTVVLTFVLLFFRPARYGRIATALVMLSALFAIGASEWTREDLRKPWIIGSYMYVNGVRSDEVNGQSVLQRAKWVIAQPPVAGAEMSVAQETAAGREVFRLQCSQCHTIDGYVGIRKLVRGQSSATIEGVIPKLATWKHRRMPPFAGSPDEKRALAVYLATLGGGKIEPHQPAISGAAVFEANCAMCHAAGAEFPIAPRVKGRAEPELYAIIGHLPERNPMMPAFEGTDGERHALAQYLAEQGR